MNRTIIPIILGIALISLASAVVTYGGDSYSFPSEQFFNYVVVGNSSNLEGMNISWDNGSTIISFKTNFKPDNFTLVFFNREEKVIKEYNYRGGGTKAIIKNNTVEVPNYITEYVNRTQIKYVNKTTSSEKKEKTKWGFSLFDISLLFLIVLYVLYVVIKKIKNNREDKNQDDQRHFTEMEGEDNLDDTI